LMPSCIRLIPATVC